MTTSIAIEQVGAGGTSLGKFTRTKPAAVAEKVTDSYGYLLGYRIRSLTSREIVGELTPTGFEGIFAAWHVDDVRGENSLAKSNVTLMEGVTAILGAPGSGYTHYRQVP